MAGRHVAAPLALALLLLAAVPPASADHRQAFWWQDQPSDESWIAFDHKGGNQWWVEVKVTGTFDQVSVVYARAESGSFHRLSLRDWGNWAGSFHIPQGERVQFHALRAGGMSNAWETTSCFFTHPGGAEQCDPGATEPLRTSFRTSGNSWWFQTFIQSNRPIKEAVLVIDDVDGGVWMPLKKESWGGWTTRLDNVPQGTTMQVLGHDGADEFESPCWRWTKAEPTSCPPDFGPAGPAYYMTRFDHVKGNEWWIEAKAGPVEPTRMWARDDGGAWVELAKRSWGVWAASFHIEPGHRVQFRALVDGETLHSCQFTHPQGLSPGGNQICSSLEYGAGE